LCGLSKDYFLKLFKNSMGITPQQYYIALAVDKGRYLLTNTSYSISEISLLCGIEDSFYFSRIFKKHTGLSPRDYRNTRGCNSVL
ncbi:MAG: helix-turn-helix transcriptional regulator, partial [Ruminococcaceae bacterium]|nr:helix-turn-helix transcriptional regulator [Oscillospiraceae bacterium]